MLYLKHSSSSLYKHQMLYLKLKTCREIARKLRRMAAVQAPDDFINLTVKIHQSGDTMFFKVKRRTKLAKLLRIFCQKKGLAFKTLQFVFSGLPVKEYNTPEQLLMEDGDEIDVFQTQMGGGAKIINMD